MGISSISDWFWGNGKTRNEEPLYTIETGENTRESLGGRIDSGNGNKNTGQYTFGSSNKSVGTTANSTNKNAVQTGSTVGGIYDNDARQTERKAQAEEKNQEVAGPVVYDTRQTEFVTPSQMKTYNNGLSYIKGSNVSKPSAGVSTVDHNYTGANDNSYTVWDDDKMRTGIGSIDSGLGIGEKVYGAVNNVAHAVHNAYEKLDDYNFKEKSIDNGLAIARMQSQNYWDEDLMRYNKLKNEYNEYLSYMTPLQKMQYERTPDYAKKDFIDNISAELSRAQAQDRVDDILAMEDETNKALQIYGVSAGSGLSGIKSDIKGAGNLLLGESRPVARNTNEYAYDMLMGSGEVSDGQKRIAGVVRNIAETAPGVAVGMVSAGAGNALLMAGDAGRIYDEMIRVGYEPYDAAKVATVLTANNALWRKGLSTLPGVTDGRSVITQKLPSNNSLTRIVGKGTSGFAEGSGRNLTEQLLINAILQNGKDIDLGDAFESGLNEGLENAVFSLPGEIAGVYGALENKYRAGYNEGEATVLKYKPTNGKDIVSTPDKTTTVLGRYDDDTKYIIRELNLDKNTNFLGNNGWFNLLNTPDEYHIVLGPELYWDEFNKPFLDAAVERGDIIVMVTPLEKNNLVKIGSGELTGYGKEYKYLTDNGYVYDNGVMKPKGGK